jgi:hypothetical protein
MDGEYCTHGLEEEWIQVFGVRACVKEAILENEGVGGKKILKISVYM